MGWNIRFFSLNAVKKNLKVLWNSKYCGEPQLNIPITKIFHYIDVLKCPVKAPKHNSQLDSSRLNSMKFKFWLWELSPSWHRIQHSFPNTGTLLARRGYTLEYNWEDARNLKIEMIFSLKLYYTILHAIKFLCTHETSTINTKILYKLNVSTKWEIKNERHWDILINSGRKPSLPNTKAVKLTKDFSFWIKSTSHLEEDGNSFF